MVNERFTAGRKCGFFWHAIATGGDRAAGCLFGARSPDCSAGRGGVDSPFCLVYRGASVVRDYGRKFGELAGPAVRFQPDDCYTRRPVIVLAVPQDNVIRASAPYPGLGCPTAV